MTRHQLQELIAGGESQTVEFKRRFTSPEKIAKELCAFANTQGGYLLFGVDDDRSIVGVESEKQEIELISLACSFYIEPPLNAEVWVVSVDGKDIVVVYVPASSQRPHRVVLPGQRRGPVFIRHQDQSVLATREMVRLLAAQRPDAPPVTITIGRRERALFEFLERHGKITVAEFARLVNISRRRAGQILVRLTRAGVLQIHVETNGDYFTLASP
ncbi:MAG: putative DNA binding domain-containing protein [Candidatus Kapabacteria bacterium]|nr:putative DNA binding domain-containing protein [Candidatus Kapabacteria bacterium]MDW8013009.1 putative DNA binding domain-containing protein [Bacteroidota bacterium]